MANTNPQTPQGQQASVNVRATVILRIPDLDASELVALYQAINNIVAQFGGEYNVDTMPQGQQITR
jgi:hypothetical protein